MIKMIFWSRVINHNKINRGMVRGERTGLFIPSRQTQLAGEEKCCYFSA